LIAGIFRIYIFYASRVWYRTKRTSSAHLNVLCPGHDIGEQLIILS